MAESVPTVAIKEANIHLQALHTRNTELEAQVISLQKEVYDLRAMLGLKHEQEQRLLGQQQIIKEKDDKITSLEKEVRRLLGVCHENSKKDLVITQLSRKCKLLNEILKYKHALESVALCLEQVEQDFIVDIDNLVQVEQSKPTYPQDAHDMVMVNGEHDDTNNNPKIDVTKLKDIAHETSL